MSTPLIDLTTLDESLVASVYSQCVQLTHDAHLSLTTRQLHPNVKCIRDLRFQSPTAHPRFEDVVAAVTKGDQPLSAIATSIGLVDAKACIDAITETLWEDNFATERCKSTPIVALMDAVRLSMTHVAVMREDLIEMDCDRLAATTHLLQRMSLLNIDVAGVQLALTLLAKPPPLWLAELADEKTHSLDRHMDMLDAPMEVDVSTTAAADLVADYQRAEREMGLEMSGEALSAQLARLREDSVEILRDMQTEVRRATDKHAATVNQFAHLSATTRSSLATVINADRRLPSPSLTTSTVDEADDISSVTSVLSRKVTLTKWSPSLCVNDLAIGDAIFAARPRLINGFTTNVYDHAKCVGYDKRAKMYTVQFENDAARERHSVGLDGVAMTSRPMFELPEGYRCIARDANNMWLAGTVGARANVVTNYRYMIMLDDGVVTYVNPDDVRILRSSAAVMGYEDTFARIRESWRSIEGDVPLGLPAAPKERIVTVRDFMHYYLDRHPDTPQIRPKVGEQLCLYRNGKSHLAKVLTVDHQLVKMSVPLSKEDAAKFGNSCIVEWIYRGSWRFKRVNDDRLDLNNKSPTKASRSISRCNLAKLSTPRQETSDAAQKLLDEFGVLVGEEPLVRKVQRSRKSTVARIAQRPIVDVHVATPRQTGVTDIYELQYMHIGDDVDYPPKHVNCSRNCLPADDADIYQSMKGRRLHARSPLLWPMHVRWRRHIVQACVTECIESQISAYHRKKRAEQMSRRCKYIIYVTPCGRKCATLQHVTDYLSSTASRLSIDLFSFDPVVDPCKVYVLTKAAYQINDDFTKGGEPMVGIRTVNAVDDDPPDNVDYVARRFGNTGRELAAAESGEWVTCCDCEDDCQSNENCACRRLTNEGARRMHKSLQPPVDNIDDFFAYRRFNAADDDDEPVNGLRSGVYECNEKCGCSRQTCHNRVAQTDMRWPLELFKTRDKGWGVRALVDIPRNHFVCIYAGAIHEDDAAEEIGAKAPENDAYFADCDMIEVYDRSKVDLDLDNDDLIQEEPDDAMEETVGDAAVPGADTLVASSAVIPPTPAPSIAPSSTAGQPSTSDNGSNGGSKVTEENLVDPHAVQVFSVREYFERDDGLLTYVVDARLKGNIGRFFNHSCDPNIVVQNMIVDTHDLRLPWIGFFASRHIDAGEELCWCYNYSLLDEDKKIMCNCGTSICQGRLR